MNHNIATAERGQNLSSPYHFCDANADAGEAFSMSGRDFVGGVLRLFGAARQRDGLWPFLGRRVADETGCFNIGAHELGWRRWRLRLGSSAEPVVLISPGGEIFWSTTGRGAPHRIWSISELVRSIGYCLPMRRAAA